MDEQDGSRKPDQESAKDFLALTHGQEWVNFYESFDNLVQDHLTRSSELLRRAMTLPEVADREVTKVRVEMEAQLAAERSRSQTLLAQLRDEISSSHSQVATLAEFVQSVAVDLSSLSDRVSIALVSLDTPLSAPSAESAPAVAEASVDDDAELEDAVVAEAPAAEETDEELAVEAVAGEEVIEASDEETVSDEGAGEEVAAEAVAEDVVADEAAAEDAGSEDAVVEAAAEDLLLDAELEPFVPEWAEPAGEVAAEPVAALAPDDELDLSALAESESLSLDDLAPEEAFATAGTGMLEGDAVGVGGDRPRPHWLSVTRIGSRT